MRNSQRRRTAEPEKKPGFRYPVNPSPLGETPLKIERGDEAGIWTVTSRFYLWQKQDETGRLLEFQADNGVIFLSGDQPAADKAESDAEDILPGGAVQAVYLSGDVVMTEGQRTIRADEIYYDFERKKAVALVFRSRIGTTSKMTKLGWPPHWSDSTKRSLTISI